MTEYKIMDDFQVNAVRVLVLDRDYEIKNQKLFIDGVEYPHCINSVKNWILIKSTLSFKGKTALFA